MYSFCHYAPIQYSFGFNYFGLFPVLEGMLFIPFYLIFNYIKMFTWPNIKTIQQGTLT